MSRDASITFRWGDGDEYRFRLAIAQLRDLQEGTGASPFVLLERITLRRPMVYDCREVLRFGLIGAGLDGPSATRLVERWCDERPLAESISPALAVLAAALYGVPDESPGKSRGATEEPTASPPGTY